MLRHLQHPARYGRNFSEGLGCGHDLTFLSKTRGIGPREEAVGAAGAAALARQLRANAALCERTAATKGRRAAGSVEAWSLEETIPDLSSRSLFSLLFSTLYFLDLANYYMQCGKVYRGPVSKHIFRYAWQIVASRAIF